MRRASRAGALTTVGRGRMSIFRTAGVGLLVIAFAEGGLSAAPVLSPDQAQVLEAARQFALGYGDRLPNFICTQIVL